MLPDLILPWAMPAIPTFISAHWLLNGQWGLINAAIWKWFEVDGPGWLTDPTLAMGAVILFYIWKRTPFWTVIFVAGRTAIPHELDEAARIDGATVPQIFVHLFMPLMTPALVAVGTYALLLAWNEYLYAFLLLSDEREVTVPVVALGLFLSSDEAPWNLLMAAAIIYSLPPLAIYYIYRTHHMTTGLTVGSVKG